MSASEIISYNRYSDDHSLSLAENVKKDEGIKGWILAWLGCSIPVYDEEHNKTVYWRLQDLVAKLCDTPNTEVTGAMLGTSKDLHRLAVETLHPIIGETITVDKVNALFSDFRSIGLLCTLESSSDAETAIQSASEQFEALKARDLQVLTFDADTLLSALKPGDILFKKQPYNSGNTVIFGQRLFSHFKRGTQERESYKFSHALLYIGNGRFVEASPNHGKSEVRTFDIDDPKFALEMSSAVQYLVTRHEDPEIAQNAAEIASKIAVNAAAGSGDHNYGYLNALRSIYLSSDFGRFGRYRYYKQYYLDRQGEMPIDAIGHKNFFCTYLVGYAYQTAEARKVMPEIVSDPDAAPPKGSNPFFSWLNRGFWTHPKISTYWNAMTEKIKLLFDAKRVTPQDFRNFKAAKPDIFRDLFLIRAENAPALISEK